MRIISGKYKKTNLYLPKKINFRPTSDFVKESLFSSINNFLLNSIFLELFCGSGNIGFEALSRGAKKVYFVDNNNFSIKILKKNIKILNISNEEYVILKKSFDVAIEYFYESKIFFDLIFADPPYEKGFFDKVLNKVMEFNILKENGLLMIEHSKREKFNIDLKALELFKILEYGDKKISFFKRR